VRLADEVRDGAVTAVFCANDYLAIGVVHALAEAGLRVPDDASVVGFDDIDGSAHLLPPLTTVRQPFERLADEVVRAIAGGEDGRGAVAPELIVRGSTAPPPGAASARRV
jgi:DNA-binding LacI/PurR family transcriptional regulator